MKRKIKHWQVIVRINGATGIQTAERVLRASTAKNAETTARRDIKRMGYCVLRVEVRPLKVVKGRVVDEPEEQDR